MKKILCLVIAIMLMLTCVGCSNEEALSPATEDTSLMFVRVEKGYVAGYSYCVVYHTETKVMYAVSYDSKFTVMVDADGNPLLWEG